MLIESQESLKGWLTSILEPMCDADPNALAKYVIALVKKDKPLPELKDTCIDQLDVFLQEETKPFVELLFEALESKSYIKKPEPTPLPAPTSSSIQPELSVASTSTTNSVTHTSPVRLSSNIVGNNIRDAKDVRESRRSRIDGQITDTDERDGKRIGGRRSLSRSRSRSRSSRSRSRNRSRSRSREREDRRPRRYNDDKRDRRGPVRRYDRYNEYRRDRSRDRDRSREHERDGERNRDRERTSRSRSRSRSKTRSRSRERDRPRPESRETNHKSTSPTTTELGDTDYRYNTAPPTVPLPSTIPPPSVASVPVSVTPEAPALYSSFSRNKSTRRCRDFDEMGYCMRGDLCEYDHGTDPVVVEDVNIPNMMGFGPPSSQGPPAPTAPIPTILGPPMLRPPLPQGPPPPPPHTPVSRPTEQQHIRNESFPHYSEPYIPEPYNPEAPSLERPPRMRTPYWGPRPGAPRGVGLRPAPPFQHPMTRELISVPTLDDVTHLDSSRQPQKNRTVVAPQKRAIDEVSKENIIEVRQDSSNTSEVANKRRLFDYNRLGPRKNNSDNSTLELRKIPRGLNSITQLNNHFSKFGKIVNLQVCYEGNPEAALLTFSTHAEANAAYRSTEAVLNNRFIKVFWHNKENNNENSKREVRAEVPNKKTSVKDRLGDPVTKPNSVSNSAPPSDDIEKTSVVLSPSGNLSKTVFNPAALKKNNVVPTPKATPAVTMETVKKKQEEQRKEVLKINANLQKRKQEILEKNIQDQKILIGKLEQKSLNPTDREKVMETLKTIQNSINVVKKDFMPPAPVNQPKTKQEAEKELLDVEMDLYNKQHQGADTTELRKKVAELKKEATALGLLDSNKSHRGRGRGRGMKNLLRGTYRGRGRGVLPSTVSVDHRPKKLLISNLEEKDRIDVLAQLAQFGEIESHDYDELNRGLVLNFKTRKDAEMFVLAYSRSSKLKDKSLHMSWYKDNTNDQVNDVGDEALTDSFVGEEELGEVEAVELLLADDEEEEDSEGRSWKR